MNPSTYLFTRDALAAGLQSGDSAASPTLRTDALRTDAVEAIRAEGADALASRSTTYSMAVSDTFNGTLSSGGDADWVRVSLQPGSYVITLDGRGASALSDPFLRVMNGSGVEILTDDDSGAGLNSQVMLNVTRAGTYYLEAGSYAGSYSGAYSLAINPLEVYTMDEIAKQLTDGYWQANGAARRAFDLSQGSTLNVDLSNLTTAGAALADMALAAWETVTGIRFNRAPAAGTEVHITFDDSDSGAYSTSEVFGGQIVRSFVNVGTDWLSSYGTGYNTYSFQTYIHEIGHALGLGHAGNYNGQAVYGVDNNYANDSWQASIMSYFSQTDNPTIRASYAYVTTAMMADILAMQDLYGETQIRTGNNTYGEQTNAGRVYSLIAGLLRQPDQRDDITFTVFDQGGTDRLDLHSDDADQRISLMPGTISSAYGLIGNISITGNTLIEQVLTGSGNDHVLGNWADNMVRGGAGRDTIYGQDGNDTLFGDQGADLLIGGAGNDVYFAEMQDSINESLNAGSDTVYSLESYQLGANVENLNLSQGSARTGTGSALDNFMIGNAVGNVLYGLSGNDTLSGAGGNDTLVGANGNDHLSGGTGRDTMFGGAGDDRYFSDGNDVIAEAAGGGNDVIYATTTVALAANVEQLVITGTASGHGFGNSLANVLTGNAGGNFLSGNGGNDSLTGGGGSDNFVFRAGRDTINDFVNNVDTIRIDDVAWGGGARTIAQVLGNAQVVDGNTVLDFGNGNTLTVNGLTDISALQDDLIIF